MHKTQNKLFFFLFVQLIVGSIMLLLYMSAFTFKNGAVGNITNGIYIQKPFNDRKVHFSLSASHMQTCAYTHAHLEI